ncbi:Tn3 family transposase [Streptomyces sp. NPDC088729]|uniref:Tn3 family transposase n=1 Tax=Streptomyces sp. NPDC088729 TaxID=3365876 RepID=UPI0037F4323F
MTSRDPELQDNAVKFLDLLAAGVIFSTSIDMTSTLRQLSREGWTLNPSDLAVLSPYRRENVLRFGDDTADQYGAGFSGLLTEAGPRRQGPVRSWCRSGPGPRRGGRPCSRP